MEVQRVSNNNISFSAQFGDSFTKKLNKYARPYGALSHDLPSLVENRFGQKKGYPDVVLTYRKIRTFSNIYGYREKESIYAEKGGKAVKLLSHYPHYDTDGHNIMRKLLRFYPEHVFDLKMKELDAKVKGVKIKKVKQESKPPKMEIKENTQASETTEPVDTPKVEIKRNDSGNYTQASEIPEPVDTPKVEIKKKKWWQLW